MGRIFRFKESHLEKLYLIKISHGKSPQLARYEVEMLRRYIKKYGKKSAGTSFKYGKDAYLDFDEDGILNAFDCQPLNAWKQDTKQFFDHRNFSTSFNMGDTSKYKVITKYMTANEFLTLARQASIGSGMDKEKTNDEFRRDVLDQGKIKKYTAEFRKGTKFPTPFLIYRGKSKVPLSHEGRLRTSAFMNVFGPKKKLPVYIVRDPSEF